MIVLVNKNDEYIPRSCDVYIGRGSALGNPWSHLPNSKAEFAAKSRADAVDKYKSWISGQSSPEVVEQLSRINKLNLAGECRLVCYCAPLPCHGTAVRQEVWKRYGMRVGVIGSRAFRNKKLVFSTLNDALDRFPHFSTIISGGASGPDTFGEQWALSVGIPTRIHIPDWLNQGKAAGFIRNKKIVEDSDVIFAFWDGKSKGTAHSISLAKERKIPVKIIS